MKRVSDRVMSMKLETEGVMMNVVSTYALRVGCEMEEKKELWSGGQCTQGGESGDWSRLQWACWRREQR